jgi:hypothetical protein
MAKRTRVEFMTPRVSQEQKLRDRELCLDIREQKLNIRESKLKLLEQQLQNESSRTSFSLKNLVLPMFSNVVVREFPKVTDVWKRCSGCNSNIITIFRYFLSIASDVNVDSLEMADVKMTCGQCRDDYFYFYQAKSQRADVWIHQNGMVNVSSCYACRQSLSFTDDWDISHDIARADGGDLHISNLFTCHSVCNRAMGTLTFREYWKSLGLTRGFDNNVGCEQSSKCNSRRLRTASVELLPRNSKWFS